MDTKNESFESILRVVKKANNDSQRFASLLIITKLLEAGKLSDHERLALFKGIGFSFPLRLIITANDDNPDCPRSVMESLGISILASFTSNEKMVEMPELRKSVPHILNILLNIKTIEPSNSTLVSDCLQIITALTNIDNVIKMLLRFPVIQLLCSIYEKSESDNDHNMIIFILTKLLQMDPELWENCVESLLNFLQLVSTDIKNDQSERKFNMIGSLNACISSMPISCAQVLDGIWIANVAHGLCDIFTSRVGPEQRNPALNLSATLTTIFKLNWTTKLPNEKKFPVLLVRLSCVEVGITVYNWDITSSENEQEVLLSCFTVLETCCSYVAEFDQSENIKEILNFDEIKSLHSSLSDAIKAIESLMEKLLETERNEFLIACLRTVSAWLNVQVYATSEMGIAIAPTVLKTIKKCLKTNADDVLKTSAPAILNYAEIMPCRNVIMESGIIQCLGEILVTPDGKISEEALCLVTQCLMVLCLESPDKGPFTMMLQSLMQLFISLPKSTSLPFYIAALALMIWNLEGAKNYVEQERFFKTLVAFLHNIHKLGETGIQITESYRKIWPSVEQLWPITVKELIRSANNEPWVKEVLLASGIKRKIQNLTSQDSGEPESELHSGYGLLLTLFED